MILAFSLGSQHASVTYHNPPSDAIWTPHALRKNLRHPQASPACGCHRFLLGTLWNSRSTTIPEMCLVKIVGLCFLCSEGLWAFLIVLIFWGHHLFNLWHTSKYLSLFLLGFFISLLINFSMNTTLSLVDFLYSFYAFDSFFLLSALGWLPPLLFLPPSLPSFHPSIFLWGGAWDWPGYSVRLPCPLVFWVLG